MQIFLFIVLLSIAGNTNSRLQMRTAITTGSNSTSWAVEGRGGSRIVSCRSPTSLLLIRTAYYLPPSNHRRSQNDKTGCVGRKDDACDMTSDDVMMVYRHCESRLTWCDVRSAGVEDSVDFEISYYCLEGPFLNPCSNITSESLTISTSLFFNFSRHYTDCDVSCRCTISPVTSNTTEILSIRALNFFEQKNEEVNETESSKRINKKGCNQTLEQPGQPRVMIGSYKRQWEVERRAVAGQWKLKEQEIFQNLSISLQKMHGVRFGYFWMDLGEAMLISCGSTILPSLPFTENQITEESTTLVGNLLQKGSQTSVRMVYIVVGVCVGMVMAVAMLIAAVKCRRHPSSYDPHCRTNGSKTSHPPDNQNQPNITSPNHSPLEGEYCTISEVSTSTSPSLIYSNTTSPPHGQDHSRDQNQPIKEEMTFSNQIPKDEGRADELSATSQVGVSGASEYGSLNHGPRTPDSALPRSEAVIYDHTGAFGQSSEGGEYHCLRHYVRHEPRVIDNVYDTMKNLVTS